MQLGKGSVKPLLLAGVAAAAYYAYTRMSEEQKKNIMQTLKSTGKDLLGRYMPNMGSKMNGSANA